MLVISNKSYSRNFIIDSKVIWHNIFYDKSVNFLCTYPFLYTAGMCDVTYIGVYNIYLHGRCFLSALYNDIICLTPPQNQHYCLCLTTQVHTRMPFPETLHNAQTNITLPAEIQRGLCLLLQRTYATSLFSFRRPVLGMFDLQSTELGRSWTWSAP